jgi:23S rRNA pseudouridine1911/1915/1917 synthase
MPRTMYKPPGTPVFPPHDAPDGDSLLRALLAEQPHRRDLAWPAGFEGGICHRLDTSTSGAVLIADDPAELEVLRAAFRSHALEKRYLLRVARVPRWTSNTCDRAIAHDARHNKRMVVQRGADTPHRGRWYPAHTAFEQRDGDLFHATITTGVMHQIRVHAAFLGAPLLGDRLYGGGPTPVDAPAGVTFFLHHTGLCGHGVATDPVPDPPWAR